ncbi:DMT family transporter [bacterium LRH843]|nr:DMT family transporter [bacterium LRH843]
MNQRSLAFTYSIIFIVMIIWGLNIVFLKLLVNNFPTATMTSFRIMLAGVVNFSIVLFSRQMRKMTKKEWIYILLGTGLGVTGHHTFLAQGLVTTEASSTVLILALLPVTTFLLAVAFLGDRLTKWRLTGIFLAFIGVVFIQGGGSVGIKIGELYIFLAMIMQAISFVFIKKASQTVDAKQITALMLLIGSGGLLVISLMIEPQGISQMIGAPLYLYILFFVSSILATAVGHLVFNAAIQRIGAGQAAIFNNFVPFFGLVSSALFLEENIYWYQYFGFIFIVLGVLFGSGYIENVWMKSKPIYRKEGDL